MKISEHPVAEASSPVQPTCTCYRCAKTSLIPQKPIFIKTYLAFDHEDYGVCAEPSAGSKKPVEVGIVGVADAQVA